eukprot:516640-Pyramimonas_sp.AAC.1
MRIAEHAVYAEDADVAVELAAPSADALRGQPSAAPRSEGTGAAGEHQMLVAADAAAATCLA